jgi:hypothetical protein
VGPQAGEVEYLDLSRLGDQLDGVQHVARSAAVEAGDGGHDGGGEGAGQQSPDIHRALPGHGGRQRDGEDGLRVNLNKEGMLSCINVL